jgi:hypothetical protein
VECRKNIEIIKMTSKPFRNVAEGRCLDTTLSNPSSVLKTSGADSLQKMIVVIRVRIFPSSLYVNEEYNGYTKL